MAADTEVPHTFEDGTPAKASEVNANFDALEAAIDAIPEGPAGEQGEKGDKGDTGATGPQGPIGLTGATGATGAKGDTGDQGAPGNDGADGDDGVVNGVTCQTNQIVRYNGTAWACADDVLATLNCDVGDRLVRGDNGWECSNSYSVSGNLTGMDSGNSVGLTLNGVSLTMSANGLFTFPNEVEAGQSYTVQVQAQPPNGTETCEVTANGSGNVLAPITDVGVHCYPTAEAYVTNLDFFVVGMTSMFDTLTPNIDMAQRCDGLTCRFRLANVSNHLDCDISWSGGAVDSAIGDPIVFKGPSTVEVSYLDRLYSGLPLTINLSCPSQ